MDSWLAITGEHPFIAFQASHITMLVVYFLGLVIFLLSINKILAKPYLLNTIRWILFSLLILSELSYQLWTAFNGIWSLRDHIPLHLCGIASITAAISLFTYRKRLIKITFFIGIVPAFLALLTPELPFDYPHLRYWKFFIHHIVISWSSIFLVATSSVKLTFKSVLETYGYLVLYAIIIGFFINPLLNSNYLYLATKPTASTPLDLLGSGIWYYTNLCLLAFAVFVMMLGFYKVFKRN